MGGFQLVEAAAAKELSQATVLEDWVALQRGTEHCARQTCSSRPPGAEMCVYVCVLRLTTGFGLAFPDVDVRRTVHK